MKKSSIIIAAILLLALTASAQKAQVKAAENAFADGKLQVAMDAINMAVKDPTTSVQARTWADRGNIYAAIFRDSTHAVPVADPLTEAYTSFEKALVLDSSKKDITDATLFSMAQLANAGFNKGVIPYNNGDYAGAYKTLYTTALLYQAASAKFQTKFGDTVMYYSANAAARAKLYDTAQRIYVKLIGLGYKNAELYRNLAIINLNKGDTATAETYLDQGTSQFPGDHDLMASQLNLYIQQKKFNGLIDKLKAALATDPQNAEFTYILGNAYDQMKDTANAALYYQKALDLKPDYFDDAYSLGAMFFNQAVKINDEITKVSYNDQATYNKLTAQRNYLFNKALPFLEKAKSLNGNDMQTLYALKEIYARLNMMDKSAEIKAKLDSLNTGH